MSGFLYDSDGPYIPKDPDAKLDYSHNWDDWLQSGETVVSSLWSASPSVTIASSRISSPKTTFWCSATNNQTVYTFRNWIKTSQKREDTRSFRIKSEKR